MRHDKDEMRILDQAIAEGRALRTPAVSGSGVVTVTVPIEICSIHAGRRLRRSTVIVRGPDGLKLELGAGDVIKAAGTVHFETPGSAATGWMTR